MRRRVSSPESVGRHRELEELDRLVGEVASAAFRLAVVSGEAGVGKSRLVEEVVRRGEDAGMRTVVGRCVEVGGNELPFAPLAEILRRLADEFGHARLTEVFGPGRSELARIVPELGEGSPQGRRTRAGARAAVRRAAGGAAWGGG